MKLVHLMCRSQRLAEPLTLVARCASVSSSQSSVPWAKMEAPFGMMTRPGGVELVGGGWQPETPVIDFLGGGFTYFFIFTPIWGRFPF